LNRVKVWQRRRGVLHASLRSLLNQFLRERRGSGAFKLCTIAR
jgi:hypothetical protein